MSELQAARKAAQNRAQQDTDDAIYKAWHSGLTYAQMADALHASQGTISAALARVQSRLGEKFQRPRRQGRSRRVQA